MPLFTRIQEAFTAIRPPEMRKSLLLPTARPSTTRAISIQMARSVSTLLSLQAHHGPSLVVTSTFPTMGQTNHHVCPARRSSGNMPNSATRTMLFQRDYGIRTWLLILATPPCGEFNTRAECLLVRVAGTLDRMGKSSTEAEIVCLPSDSTETAWIGTMGLWGRISHLSAAPTSCESWTRALAGPLNPLTDRRAQPPARRTPCPGCY